MTELATGITSANVAHLRHITVSLPGTVDSSPIYLHEVSVDGAVHDVIVVMTTYGKTMAIDADSGKILWTFTPPGYSRWAGSAQITVASPLADPDRQYVYATSPNGLIHKLSLADGSEDTSGAWPVKVTLEPLHEKLGAALNIDGPDLVVATSGYFGDIPPYQGHVVLIERSSGRLLSVFNTLCVEPPLPDHAQHLPGQRLGDPLALRPGRRARRPAHPDRHRQRPVERHHELRRQRARAHVPGTRSAPVLHAVDQEQLNTSDTDLGSSAPALLGDNRVVLAGKDGIFRVLDLSRLNGRSPSSHTLLGGELQRLPIPGGGELFTAPAVWRHDGHTTMFVGDEHATAAYVLRRGRLYLAWQNSTPGTSPVMAGGLLYVYDPSAGGIYVYRPDSPRPIAKLAGEPGHWNSPIVVDGHIVEPEGDANAHETSGTLEIFSAG